MTEMFFRTVVMLTISTAVCRGSEPSSKSYGSSTLPQDNNNNNNNNNYQNNNNYYESEFQRPFAVFTERPVNVADFVLIPVVQVPSSDLRMVYRPQIDSVSKTEPIVVCRSLTKSFEATPAVQVPLQQPFYLYDERTLIPFPKTVTILHGGYRMSIPVGVVVAPVPVGALRAGPVLVTTLYAIPAGPVPVTSPVPVRLVPWSSYPAPQPAASQYLHGPPLSPPPPPPMGPLYPQPAPPTGPLYSQPAPSYAQPPAYPSPPASSYAQSPAYPSPPAYSQPAPPSPAYYQHQSSGDGDYSEDSGGGDLRIRDPPGKLYSQAAAAAISTPFHNSKESPVLNQLREESEKNRIKYGLPPPYSNHYQTVDA